MLRMIGSVFPNNPAATTHNAPGAGDGDSGSRELRRARPATGVLGDQTGEEISPRRHADKRHGEEAHYAAAFVVFD